MGNEYFRSLELGRFKMRKRVKKKLLNFLRKFENNPRKFLNAGMIKSPATII